MVVRFTERSPQYWQLQMAARLAVQNNKEAIAREGKHFSEIRQLKSFDIQRRPGWLVPFVAHASYAGTRSATNTQQTDREIN